LVSPSNNSHVKRLTQGVEQNRLALLIAVLQRYGSLSLVNEDVFINVVSGLKINETAVDLPTVLAITSSFKDINFSENLVCFGEIGLAGEIRPVRYGVERIGAAVKQGFTKIIIPVGNLPKKNPKGIEVIGVHRLSDALDLAL
jgi:DNA repair protein RadA/Sms